MAKRENLDELIVANKENALELVTANKLIATQDDKKGKHIAKLIVANKENALELVTANKLIATQDEEIKKRAAELIIAYKELALQNKDKEKRAIELIIARKELAFQAELVIANEEKVKRADELIIANKELKQLLQLNADKDLFISILAHDLRSPFNALLGLSELLTEDIRKLDIDEIEDIANNINKSAQNSFKLLENILIWARAQSGKIPFKPQILNFRDICLDIFEILNSNANAKNITINYSASDEINVYADIDMLKSVLRNLVSNAIKFTNNCGAININAEENSGNVTISVSDYGIGIKPNDLTKLFDISQVLTTTGTSEETGTVSY